MCDGQLSVPPACTWLLCYPPTRRDVCVCVFTLVVGKSVLVAQYCLMSLGLVLWNSYEKPLASSSPSAYMPAHLSACLLKRCHCKARNIFFIIKPRADEAYDNHPGRWDGKGSMCDGQLSVPPACTWLLCYPPTRRDVCVCVFTLVVGKSVLVAQYCLMSLGLVLWNSYEKPLASSSPSAYMPAHLSACLLKRCHCKARNIVFIIMKPYHFHKHACDGGQSLPSPKYILESDDVIPSTSIFAA